MSQHQHQHRNNSCSNDDPPFCHRHANDDQADEPSSPPGASGIFARGLPHGRHLLVPGPIWSREPATPGSRAKDPKRAS